MSGGEAVPGPDPQNWSGRSTKNRAQFSMERGVPMPRKKFSDEQVAFALRQAETGTLVGENCRSSSG